ncbi:hypothetical protein QUA56_13630 [Microcoleus sp. N3A4]|uniref:hypothetical protein n=1 Tax=Microcoleus sp. N3A4 TaxID=3055379 RepID=UPI002FD29080
MGVPPVQKGRAGRPPHFPCVSYLILIPKKLNGKPKIRPSTLNQEKKKPKPEGKRPGSSKRRKKTDFLVNEQRIIEPEGLPEGATFNGYREYDVQDLILSRRNIRFLLAEYVTALCRTVVGIVQINLLHE